MDHSFFVKIIIGLKLRILGCLFSKINFVRMPHKGWMKMLNVCPKLDGNCSAPSWSSSCTVVCKKVPRVLFLPQVRSIMGNFLLKLLLVEAFGNKV